MTFGDAIDWTQVIVFGIPAYIAAIFAGIASIIAARNGRAIKTSNGRTIGELVEDAHAISTSNAAALDTLNAQPQED